MAGATVIHDLIDGLAEHLTLAWQRRPLAGVPSCAFNAWGVADLKQADGTGAEVAIQLVRVAHNEHLRNRPPASLPTGRRGSARAARRCSGSRLMERSAASAAKLPGIRPRCNSSWW